MAMARAPTAENIAAVTRRITSRVEAERAYVASLRAAQSAPVSAPVDEPAAKRQKLADARIQELEAEITRVRQQSDKRVKELEATRDAEREALLRSHAALMSNMLEPLAVYAADDKGMRAKPSYDDVAVLPDFKFGPIICAQIADKLEAARSLKASNDAFRQNVLLLDKQRIEVENSKGDASPRTESAPPAAITVPGEQDTTRVFQALLKAGTRKICEQQHEAKRELDKGPLQGYGDSIADKARKAVVAEIGQIVERATQKMVSAVEKTVGDALRKSSPPPMPSPMDVTSMATANKHAPPVRPFLPAGRSSGSRN
jgi:hypothetical protein